MRRWLFTWRPDAPAAPKPDKLERQALQDLESAVPRPMPFQRPTGTGYEVHEGSDSVMAATTVQVNVQIYCGRPQCRHRHLEPLNAYGDSPIFTCPRCKAVNVKVPLRQLLGRQLPDNIDGQWGQLPVRRKPTDSMR